MLLICVAVVVKESEIASMKRKRTQNDDRINKAHCVDNNTNSGRDVFVGPLHKS